VKHRRTCRASCTLGGRAITQYGRIYRRNLHRVELIRRWKGTANESERYVVRIRSSYIATRITILREHTPLVEKSNGKLGVVFASPSWRPLVAMTRDQLFFLLFVVVVRYWKRGSRKQQQMAKKRMEGSIEHTLGLHLGCRSSGNGGCCRAAYRNARWSLIRLARTATDAANALQDSST
jgi:hypothetical protein